MEKIAFHSRQQSIAVSSLRRDEIAMRRGHLGNDLASSVTAFPKFDDFWLIGVDVKMRRTAPALAGYVVRGGAKKHSEVIFLLVCSKDISASYHLQIQT